MPTIADQPNDQIVRVGRDGSADGLRKAGSVNHRFPSGPAVMPSGRLPEGRGNSPIRLPDVSISPTWSFPARSGVSVNHRLPSRPAAIPSGSL